MPWKNQNKPIKIDGVINGRRYRARFHHSEATICEDRSSFGLRKTIYNGPMIPGAQSAGVYPLGLVFTEENGEYAYGVRIAHDDQTGHYTERNISNQALIHDCPERRIFARRCGMRAEDVERMMRALWIWRTQCNPHEIFWFNGHERAGRVYRLMDGRFQAT